MTDRTDPTMSKPSWWFANKLIPVLRRYDASRFDEDLARLAASDMNHFADRVFKFCKQRAPAHLGGRTVEAAIIDIANSNKALGLIRLVCNAQKHHLIKRKSMYWAASDMMVSQAHDVWILDETGRPTWSVGAVLMEAEQFWCQWLQSHPGT